MIKKERPTVEIVKPTHQPSNAELATDLRVNVTFEQGVQALVKRVNVKYVDKL